MELGILSNEGIETSVRIAWDRQYAISESTGKSSVAVVLHEKHPMLTKKIKTRVKKVLLFIIVSVSLMDKNIFLSAKLETEMSFQPSCKVGLIPTY